MVLFFFFYFPLRSYIEIRKHFTRACSGIVHGLTTETGHIITIVARKCRNEKLSSFATDVLVLEADIYFLLIKLTNRMLVFQRHSKRCLDSN